MSFHIFGKIYVNSDGMWHSFYIKEAEGNSNESYVDS